MVENQEIWLNKMKTVYQMKGLANEKLRPWHLTDQVQFEFAIETT